jgi:hypothetical protein
LSEGKVGGNETSLSLQHDEPAPGEGMIGGLSLRR